MLIAVAIALVALPADPDGVVSTAPRGDGSVLVGAVAPTTDAVPDAALAGRVTTQSLSTQEQIDRWISARAPEAEPFAQPFGPEDDRQMHGYVSGSIGTGDYSNVSVGVSVPVGENGRLDLAYSQTKNGYGYGYPGYGYGADYPGRYGYGYGLAGRSTPFGVYDPVYSAAGGSSRSVSLGYSWDRDKDRDSVDRRDPRRPLRTLPVTAED